MCTKDFDGPQEKGVEMQEPGAADPSAPETPNPRKPSRSGRTKEEIARAREELKNKKAQARDVQYSSIQAKISELTQGNSQIMNGNNNLSTVSLGHSLSLGVVSPRDLSERPGEKEGQPQLAASLKKEDRSPGVSSKANSIVSSRDNSNLVQVSLIEETGITGNSMRDETTRSRTVSLDGDKRLSTTTTNFPQLQGSACVRDWDDDYFEGRDKERWEYPLPEAKPLERAKFQWRQGELIGAGAYGRVFLGLNFSTGQLMAVKRVPIEEALLEAGNNDPRITALEREIELLGSLSNPNIVGYLGMEYEDGHINIFLEFVPGGSIASLLKKFGRFSESLVRVYTKQLLQGLAYLHCHGIVHRDIKGGNILVDINGTCKVADFGASSSLADLSKERPTLQGTPYWMAPEVIRQQGYGRKVDIWSVGCTVLEMCTGRPPWSEFQSHTAALMHIASATEPPALPESLSEEGKDFVLKCLDRNPARRPTVIQLLEHPFVSGVKCPGSAPPSLPSPSPARAPPRSVTPAPTRSDSSESLKSKSLNEGRAVEATPPMNQPNVTEETKSKSAAPGERTPSHASTGSELIFKYPATKMEVQPRERVRNTEIAAQSSPGNTPRVSDFEESKRRVHSAGPLTSMVISPRAFMRGEAEEEPGITIESGATAADVHKFLSSAWTEFSRSLAAIQQ